MLNYVEYGKENKYDDDIFFQKYSQMSRSQQGLAGAGEWETLRKLLPDFKDKRVLDLGCGYGWHCIYAMEHGASSVVGVDISHKMLEVAKEKTHFPQVEYKCCAIEDVEFPEESFDVILSSLAFHYVADYEILVKKIYRILPNFRAFLLPHLPIQVLPVCVSPPMCLPLRNMLLKDVRTCFLLHLRQTVNWRAFPLSCLLGQITCRILLLRMVLL